MTVTLFALALSSLALVSCEGARSAYGPRVTRVTFSEGFALFQSHVPPSVYADDESLAKIIPILDKSFFFVLDENYEPVPHGAPPGGGFCSVEAVMTDGKSRRVTITNFAEEHMCELLLEAYDAGLRRPYCEVCRNGTPGTFQPKKPLPPGELTR